MKEQTKELVIKISDGMYQAIVDGSLCCLNTLWYNALKDGKLLPPGHGRLIDIDKAIATEEVFHKYFHIAINPLYGNTIGCTAPTVIEADKEDKNE